MSLDEVIEKKVGEVRTDALDLSLGELISLYKNKEFVIEPDFQRFFRWSYAQRSRLIESVLLELPVPQIFVIEGKNGVLELIDGLQRISSVIHFVESELIDETPLTLEGCDLIPQLNNKLFTDLPLSLRLRIKRSTVRAVVIKRQSSSMLRYEMFKRLNTGGSKLSEQEIRNCNARMVGKKGTKFYEFLTACANEEAFKECTSTLPDSEKEEKGDEELVLRFLSLKNGFGYFKGNVRDWLDEYMESVILSPKTVFNYEDEKEDFVRLFEFLRDLLGDGAFVRYRKGQPIGGLAPAHFEAVTLGTWRAIDQLEGVSKKATKQILIETVESSEFRSFVGPGSNSLTKFRGRIDTIEKALLGLVK